jgi:hypothetical protein
MAVKVLLNFDGVEGHEFMVVPAGIYNATVDTSQTELLQSQSGNNYLTIRFVITDGEYQGVKVMERFSLQHKALWKLKMLLKAVGYPIPSGQFPFNAATIHGRPVRIKVSVGTYEGRERNRIEAFASPGGNGKALAPHVNAAAQPAAKQFPF